MTKLSRWLTILTLITGLSLSTACMNASDPSTPSMQLQDEKLALLVSLSTGHHKRADLALREGQRQDAKQEMMTLLDTAEQHLPGDLKALKDAAPNPQHADYYDVVFDASGRLARLQLEDKETLKAEASAQRGLHYAPLAPPTLFKGHLYQILADVLEAKQDPRGAIKAHGDAITIFKSLLDRHEASQNKPGSTPEEKP